MSMTKEESETVIKYVRALGSTLISGEQRAFQILKQALTEMPDELFDRESALVMLDTVISGRGKVVLGVADDIEKHCAELELMYAKQVH